MGAEGPDEGLGERWTFSEAALEQVRDTARRNAIEVLQGALSEGAERRAGAREPPKPVGLKEGLCLELFYAKKVPELCDLCDAPADVRWTAVMFYRRFFAVRSPMEFDPLPLMFACVHVACKVEEVHAITLERLLEAADFGADEGLKARVTRCELPLLEGLGFDLLVEPKPHTAMRMLVEELRSRSSARAAQSPALAALGAEAWREVSQRAEALALELAVRSDALLRWPASVAIAAALGAALDHATTEAVAERGGGAGVPASGSVVAFLRENLGAEAQREAVGSMFEEALHCAKGLSSQQEITEEAVKEVAKSARRCHRVFERMGEVAAESSQAQRKERKRKCGEMKSASQRQVPTPILSDLMDLNRKLQTSSGCAELHSGSLRDVAPDTMND